MSEEASTGRAAAGGEPEEVHPQATGSDPAEGGQILRGTTVAPGLALGTVHLKADDLSLVTGQRVPREGIERELNRFHRALVAARAQLSELKTNLSGRVSLDDTRILDVHVAYLKDSVFISDVENLIINEQLTLEGSIAKVITDFDRIFRLVPNETLRERAIDLRDVGIRVLRCLEKESGAPDQDPPPPRDYVLVARELSIVDMFNLEGEHVLGILTEEGGLTSHAAILARSMRIPTLIGVENLLERVHEGQFVMIDATDGLVRVEPGEEMRAQFHQSRRELDQMASSDEPGSVGEPCATRDGVAVGIAAACGSLPEVEQAVALGCASIGLYRTELMFIMDREPPTREALQAHYRAVFEEAGTRPVTIRLLDAHSNLGIGYMHEDREPNPELGLGGVRALLARESILRLQLQAILRAAGTRQPRLALPFVNDCGELRRVRDILHEERIEQRKAGGDAGEKPLLGAVIETPASALGVRDLAGEADFLIISLDSLMQYLLASDRGNHDLADTFESIHPIVLRALRKIASVCSQTSIPLSVFGVTAARTRNLPLLLGAGLREFCLPPVDAPAFLREVAGIDSAEAARTAEAAARRSSPEGARPAIGAYSHGYARP